MTSLTVKSVVDSLVVKVRFIVASLVVEPSLTPVVVLVIATVGDVVSITIALLTTKEPAAPIAGSVKVALFNAASFIVPEFSASEVVAT